MSEYRDEWMRAHRQRRRKTWSAVDMVDGGSVGRRRASKMPASVMQESSASVGNWESQRVLELAPWIDTVGSHLCVDILD